MRLQEIYDNTEIGGSQWLVWKEETFQTQTERPKEQIENRDVLAHVYDLCVKQVNAPYDQASRYIRSLWIEEVKRRRSRSLPRIIAEDGFLWMYAMGRPLSVDLFRRIWRHIGEPLETKIIELNPLYIEWNLEAKYFFDIDATPPGILSKLFSYWRLRKDKELLEKVCKDLERVRDIQDQKRREWLTLAILSHGAAYREINGLELLIPSLSQAGRMESYFCKQHLIAEGVKTISLFPKREGEVAIYLCQGTELWPSQSSMLGSILANFATHGAATQAYAHSWRRIHKHLRDLPGRPIVAGHSMGGSLAVQIGLYSHELIERTYAFNPPVPNERDDRFYRQLSRECQEKIQVSANLDDFAFWRIGAKVVGNVILFLGRKRWRYIPVTLWDCIFLIPAFVKFILNVRHAFPAHQNICRLYQHCVSFQLTQEEIEKENLDRLKRFDYLRFFPKLYNPLLTLVTSIRRIFGWSHAAEYLRNEIEIIALHERDLIDTITEENKEAVENELKELRYQKGELIRKLLKISS